MGQGKVAVVSGAAGRIGAAVAGTLATGGYRVIGLCRSAPPDRAEPAVGRYVRCDVTVEEDVERARREVGEETGHVDALVNCVGILGTSPPRPGRSATARTVAVNLTGVMQLCDAFRALLTERGACVVNVSSMLAVRPARGTAAYAASKAGLEAYSRALALDWAPDVRVNVVRPALVSTDIWRKGGMSEEQCAALAASRAASSPLGRAGTVEDVAGAVRYLVSEDASWLTGAVLAVDGGAGV